MTISNNTPLSDGSIGEGWVKLVDDGKFYITKTYKANKTSYSYNIKKINSEGDPSDILPTFVFNETLRDSKNLYLYIRDEKYNKYVKINISFISEYL